jgi:cell wall-associated NlpC family hydrolase
MTDIEVFIGIPWKIGGRDFSGIDCGGLCMLAGKLLFGINIPDLWVYDDTNNLKAAQKAFSWLSGEASNIEEPDDGDIVVFKTPSGYLHYGIVVNGRMLHISEGSKSKLSRIPRGEHVSFWRLCKWV